MPLPSLASVYLLPSWPPPPSVSLPLPPFFASLSSLLRIIYATVSPSSNSQGVFVGTSILLTGLMPFLGPIFSLLNKQHFIKNKILKCKVTHLLKLNTALYNYEKKICQRISIRCQIPKMQAYSSYINRFHNRQATYRKNEAGLLYTVPSLSVAVTALSISVCSLSI